MRIFPAPSSDKASPPAAPPSLIPSEAERIEAVEKAIHLFQNEVQRLQRTVDELKLTPMDIHQVRESLETLDHRFKELETRAAAVVSPLSATVPQRAETQSSADQPTTEPSIKEALAESTKRPFERDSSPSPLKDPEAPQKSLMVKMWKYLNDQKAA